MARLSWEVTFVQVAVPHYTVPKAPPDERYALVIQSQTHAAATATGRELHRVSHSFFKPLGVVRADLSVTFSTPINGHRQGVPQSSYTSWGWEKFLFLICFKSA